MEVARTAADDLKRVHLELGGKAPVVVFDDADVAAAAEGIAGAGYFNAGQDCTAATRVLAAPGIAADLTAALGEQANSTTTGGHRIGDRGWFLEPTVVAGLRQHDEMIQDEIFGPVITVQEFSGEDEALR